MKKRLSILALLFGLALGAVSAQTGNVAIGPIYSVDFLDIQSPLHGLGITGKIPGLAPVWGLNFSFGSASNFLGLTSDWILYKQPIYEPAHINFYMGPGFYASMLVSNSSRFDFGLRIPVGINWVPTKFLEIFAELTPAFGITIQDPIAPAWLIQSAVGARVWF